MAPGAILPPVSTAEQHPAALVGTPQLNTEIIAIPLAHGASTVIRSTDVQKPARPAAHLLMTMLTTAIPMGAGHGLTIRSTSAARPALFAVTVRRSMGITPTRMAMESVMIAARMSR